nr:putative reverse transcriptase domain-containing protein [Tanacetum cinerariifolium]
MTINSNLPPKIHKAQVESLKKDNVKDKNLHGMDKEFKNRLDGTLCIRRRSWHPHLCQQVLDVSKDEGRLPEAIWFTEQLSRVHSTFHVSKLKKCMAEEPLAIPLDEIQVDDKLNFIKEPVEIMDREVKRLKQSRIPIVKVHWNSKRGHVFTWEREDQMQKKYLHLFTNSAPAAEFRARNGRNGKLVERLGNVEEKSECKKLKKELEESRFSNTFLQDLCEERPNEATDSVKDEERTLKELRGESS